MICIAPYISLEHQSANDSNLRVPLNQQEGALKGSEHLR